MSRNIKLVALDLDGTLFDPAGNVSRRDREAIRAAVDSGVEVMISTGRPYVGVPVALAEELGIRYALTTNGAAVYTVPEKRLVYENCMEPALVADIIRELMRMDVYFDVFIDGNGYNSPEKLHLIPDLVLSPSLLEYIRTTRINTPDLADMVAASHGVQKITINFRRNAAGELSDRAACKDMLESIPEIAVVSGGFHNLEFTRSDTAKGRTLSILADRLGIPVAETMAVGDTQNDMNIVEMAGVGVAMGNAEPQLKEIAQFVSLSNEESGVAYAIEKLVLEG